MDRQLRLYKVIASTKNQLVIQQQEIIWKVKQGVIFVAKCVNKTLLAVILLPRATTIIFVSDEPLWALHIN